MTLQSRALGNHPARSNYELSFATEVNSSGLSVFHGETIDLDHAICLTTAVLSVFDLPEMVTITAAFTCSKSRTDEFGGMTILVTKDTHYYQDGCQFSRLMNEAHKAGIQYALCKVTHYHGESRLCGKLCPELRRSGFSPGGR